MEELQKYMKINIKDLEFQRVTSIKDLKRGHYVIADRLDGNWMTEGRLEGIIWSTTHYPPKWVVKNYPEIKSPWFESMYGRAILRTSSGRISSFPCNPCVYSIKQSLSPIR